MAKHVHAEAIKAWADGAEIERRKPAEKNWHLVDFPTFLPDHSYRVYDKWREVKEAFKAGKAVEYRVRPEIYNFCTGGDVASPWCEVHPAGTHFSWPDQFEYRLKPEKVEKKVYAEPSCGAYTNRYPPNLKLTFEDDKLIAAEVL